MKNVITPFKQNIIWAGNSLCNLSAGNTINGHAAKNACETQILAAGKKIAQHNFSVPGIDTPGLISAFPTTVGVMMKKGDIVIFNEAVNGFHAGKTAAQVYADTLSFRTLVKNGGGLFVGVSCTADNSQYAVAGQEQIRLDYNVMLRNNASTIFDAFYDMGGDSRFNSIAATADTTYYYTDFLHLSAQGYTILGQGVATAITPILR